MARRIQVKLMENGTGNGSAIDWPGGRGVLYCTQGAGGSIGFQQQAPDGTWIPIIHFATTTDISLAAGKMANFEIPAGPIRVAAGAATGVYAYAIGVPLTAAG